MNTPDEVSVHELAAAAVEGAVVVDVREPGEYASGHIPEAILMPLATVPVRYPELPRNQPLYLVCAVGARSMQAAHFLVQLGFDARNVAGGTHDWMAAGMPIDTGLPADDRE
ncbi:MAG TPA: rhodanese-like domain-containing protein [Jiangellaceae bacterium]|nr:rhodanese-like domain-containing protein [Jiangellaceae bacterium]